MNCLHPFGTENKHRCNEKVCKKKYFCKSLYQLRKDNILKVNQNMKSDKAPCTIYADLRSLIKKKITVKIFSLE